MNISSSSPDPDIKLSISSELPCSVEVVFKTWGVFEGGKPQLNMSKQRGFFVWGYSSPVFSLFVSLSGSCC